MSNYREVNCIAPVNLYRAFECVSFEPAALNFYSLLMKRFGTRCSGRWKGVYSLEKQQRRAACDRGYFVTSDAVNGLQSLGEEVCFEANGELA